MTEKPDLLDGTWKPMCDPYNLRPMNPLSYQKIEVYREGWDSPVIQVAGCGDPHTNAEGLFWRPA